MPMFRGRPQPVVIVHRDTLLNAYLSPTARLTYAVLAATEDNFNLETIAQLVGLPSISELRTFIGELTAAGIVELGVHEGVGETLTVHQMPLLPEQRTHVCVPCQDCGGCSCEHLRGLCQACDSIRRARATARADIARWKQQLEAGAVYAISSNGSRIHRWDCPTLSTPEQRLDVLEAQIPHAARGAVFWSGLPQLYTAEELRAKGTRRKNCATCGPDPL